MLWSLILGTLNLIKFVGLRHEHTHTHIHITLCCDFATAKTVVDFVCSYTWAKMYYILCNEHALQLASFSG
jgi:hypothetical protein